MIANPKMLAPINTTITVVGSAMAIATPATAYFSPLAITFAESQKLLERLGNADFDAIMHRFDPSETLAPGPFLKLHPMDNKRDRALAHEIIEEVWGDKLIHQTARRTQEMHLWVPGSKVS